MPGTAHRVADHQAVGEGSGVMRAVRADGKEVVGLPRHEHGFAVRVASDHPPVGNLRPPEAQGEVRAAQLSVFSTHLCAPFERVGPSRYQPWRSPTGRSACPA